MVPSLSDEIIGNHYKGTGQAFWKVAGQWNYIFSIGAKIKIYSLLLPMLTFAAFQRLLQSRREFIP